MDKQHKQHPDSGATRTRRSFIGNSILGGLSIALGYFTGRIIPEKESEPKAENETVKMITADGKVVEMERKHLPAPSKRKPASNKDLQDWIEEERKGI